MSSAKGRRREGQSSEARRPNGQCRRSCSSGLSEEPGHCPASVRPSPGQLWRLLRQWGSGVNLGPTQHRGGEGRAMPLAAELRGVVGPPCVQGGRWCFFRGCEQSLQWPWPRPAAPHGPPAPSQPALEQRWAPLPAPALALEVPGGQAAGPTRTVTWFCLKRRIVQKGRRWPLANGHARATMDAATLCGQWCGRRAMARCHGVLGSGRGARTAVGVSAGRAVGTVSHLHPQGHFHVVSCGRFVPRLSVARSPKSALA